MNYPLDWENQIVTLYSAYDPYCYLSELPFLKRVFEQHMGIKMTSVLLGSHLERPQRELLADLARSGEKAVFLVFLRPQAVKRLLNMVRIGFALSFTNFTVTL